MDEMPEFNKIKNIDKLSIEELSTLLKATKFMNKLFTFAGIGAMLLMMFFPYIILIIPGLYAVYVLSKMSIASNEILLEVHSAAAKLKR